MTSTITSLFIYRLRSFQISDRELPESKIRKKDSDSMICLSSKSEVVSLLFSILQYFFPKVQPFSSTFSLYTIFSLWRSFSFSLEEIISILDLNQIHLDVLHHRICPHVWSLWSLIDTSKSNFYGIIDNRNLKFWKFKKIDENAIICHQVRTT